MNEIPHRVCGLWASLHEEERKSEAQEVIQIKVVTSLV